ncbi:MAG: ATP-dependent DNA helicase [Gammaproteobacteria bacterium]|nr:ATP-dependent DNA helicase [Gammaproteobacteria bacterium]
MLEALASDGPLSFAVDRFVAREGQQRMALAVAETLADGGCLIAEAGPGAGKTLAYLVPALLAGRRSVISTHSRNLQDQLFLRDLPQVSEALGRPVKVRMLKGRANYLCRYRLARAAEAQGELDERERIDLESVRSWADHTVSGDLAQCQGVPENAPILRRVTSTRENCLGKDCPDFESCHVFRARDEAVQARIVVVNHHVLMADLQLKAAGADGLLPRFDCVVVDEAHALPEVARESLALTLGTGQIVDALKDIQREALAAGVWAEVEDEHDALRNAVRDLRLACPREPGETDWTPAMLRREIEMLDFAMEQLLECCEDAVDDEQDALMLATAGLREMRDRLGFMSGALDELRQEQDFEYADYAYPDADFDADPAVAGNPRAGWIRTTRSHVSLNLTPVDVAADFQRLVEDSEASWIFSSATLSIDGDFTHFARRLGFEDTRELLVESPYDYQRNALLFVPRDLPVPGRTAEGFTGAVLDAALPVAAAARGRAFLLFTSYRALNEAKEILSSSSVWKDRFVAQGAGRPRSLLLEEFRSRRDCILLGTRSFWQGVDVRGEDLILVVIDRLPFEAPGNPVYRARQQAVRARGGDPFNEISLPEAVLALKQGVGRLVRGETDKGIVMICDQRLLTKGYGRRFLASLPPMPLTRDPDEALSFMTRVAAAPRQGAA